MRLNNSTLHHYILNYIVKTQKTPSNSDIAKHFDVALETISNAMNELAKYHGIVLHPNTSNPWVIHPFSLSPSLFTLISDQY